MTPLDLPIEVWMRIFIFTDNETFHSFTKFIITYDANFGNMLMKLICRDVVKYNNKIVMMINLINNYDYFIQRKNYMQFRFQFIADEHRNNVHMIKYIPDDTKNTVLYRECILKNWEKIFKNDKKRRQMFTNQTRSNRAEYDRIDLEGLDYMKFYENKINIDDIVKYTVPYKINTSLRK